MAQIHQPHDKLFKETFGDLEVTEDFLTHYLPEKLLQAVDLKALEMIHASFIEEKLRESQSDLLYKTVIDGKEGYIYFLFEHKSYPAEDIAVQLLAYISEIWKHDLRKAKAKELPFIVPLVIYHGNTRWENLKRVKDWIANYDDLADDFKRFLPNFDLLLFDFSYQNRLEAKGDPKLKAYLKLMQHIFLKDWEIIIPIIVEIESMLLRNGYGRYFDTITIYIVNSRKKVPIEEIQRRLSEEGRKIFMTTAEELIRKGELIGEERGEKRGEKRGKMEEKLAVVKNALQMGMDYDQITQLTGLSSDEIDKIARDIKQN